ncbi:MAG: acetylxylan esterase [Brachybacterium sp.]
MALFDMPLDALREYRPTLEEPADLEDFWDQTLTQARTASAPILAQERVENGLTLVDTWDVTLAGHGGAPVRAWYNRPAGTDGDLPVIVEYLGYGGGRGEPLERLAWAAAGYGHLLMDSRGQGSGWGAGGHTADPAGSGPAAPVE